MKFSLLLKRYSFTDDEFCTSTMAIVSQVEPFSPSIFNLPFALIPRVQNLRLVALAKNCSVIKVSFVFENVIACGDEL